MQMTPEARQQYIDNLIKTQGANLTGVEHMIWGEFQSTQQRFTQLSQRLTDVDNEARQLSGAVQSMRGQLDAYISLLIKNEEQRVDVTPAAAKEPTNGKQHASNPGDTNAIGSTAKA